MWGRVGEWWKHHFFQALWMSQQKKNDVTPHRFYHFQCHRRTPTEHNRTPQQTTASPPPFYLCRVIFFPVQLALVLKMQISPFYSGWACWMLWGAAAVRGHALQFIFRWRSSNFTFPGTYRITTELKLPWRTGSVLFCSREVDPYHTKLNYNAKNEEQ